jgi:shikimate kinase
MKTNLTLIGMPGSGKSTVGIVLAKNLGLGFIDTDVLIQINQQRVLQEILDQSGYLGLRAIEEAQILNINIDDHVIATGGSAVYSEKAMTHLKRISTIIFLEATFEVIQRRIRNFDTRGIAKAQNQSFKALFEERQLLYQKHAQIRIDCNTLDQDRLAEKIALVLEK